MLPEGLSSDETATGHCAKLLSALQICFAVDGLLGAHHDLGDSYDEIQTAKRQGAPKHG